jgi:hypothetical protein
MVVSPTLRRIVSTAIIFDPLAHLPTGLVGVMKREIRCYYLIQFNWRIAPQCIIQSMNRYAIINDWNDLDGTSGDRLHPYPSI